MLPYTMVVEETYLVVDWSVVDVGFQGFSSDPGSEGVFPLVVEPILDQLLTNVFDLGAPKRRPIVEFTLENSGLSSK